MSRGGFPTRGFVLGRYLAAMLALLSGLAAVGFVLAPVVEHTATYRWQATPGDEVAGLPLNPYRPAELRLTVPCSVIKQAGSASNAPLVATTREGGGGSVNDLSVEVVADRLVVRSQGKVLLSTPGDWTRCRAVVVEVTSLRSTVKLDGRSLADVSGDWRPVVRGFFTTGDVEGLSAVVVADTRYDTSPTPEKVLLGVVAVLALAGAICVVALRRHQTWPTFRAAGLGRGVRRWAGGLGRLDAFVAVVMAYVVVVGPVTDDDGFIVRIIRTPAVSGFVGNYVRWNNTPEAPFGWFYGWYAAWSQVGVEPLWLRIPPLLLGLVSWWLLAHVLLPRLLTRPALSVQIGVAAAFLSLWFSFGNTLRPEPWVGLGLAAVVVLVDVAVVRRDVAVLALAATVAALSVGVGPSGIVAFGPFLIAAPRLGRWLRALAGPERLTGVLVVLAGIGVVTVPMFADQSWAAVRAGTAIRTGLGPNFPWWEDWRRYVGLAEAPFLKQWAVYLVALATVFAGAVALLGPRVGGVCRPFQLLALGSVALLPPLIGLAPTKVHHHFGALMLVGPLVVGLALHVLRSGPRLRPLLWGAAVVGLAAGLGTALAAPSDWWELSQIGIANATRPQQIGGVALATPVLAGGVLAGLAVVLAASLTGRPRISPSGLVGRVVSVFVAGVVALPLVTQLGSFGVAAARRADGYTLAAANLHTIALDPCLLERSIQVEPDPGGAALPARYGAADFTSPETLKLPTWAPGSPSGSWRSGWFDLPTDVRDGSFPLVIRTRGLANNRVVRVEFDKGSPVQLRPDALDQLPHQFVDHTVTLPDDAATPSRTRLIAEWSQGQGQFGVSVPRAQRWTSVQALSRRAPVTASWKLAFFASCLPAVAETAGSVGVPRYWLTRAAVLNELEWAARAGGPLAGLQDLVTLEPLPTRPSTGSADPTLDGLRVYALIPRYTSLVSPPDHATVRRG